MFVKMLFQQRFKTFYFLISVTGAFRLVVAAERLIQVTKQDIEIGAQDAAAVFILAAKLLQHQPGEQLPFLENSLLQRQVVNRLFCQEGELV